ncbi:MAG: amidohydrolase family protein [Cyclobacteriaceae bacterium]
MLKNDELLRIVILLLFFGVLPKLTQAQDSDLRPVTSKYVLKNVTIVQAPGRTIQNGTVLIENGIIKAVGTSISVPADTWVVDTDSMYVYAGFISGLSNIGVDKPKDREGNDDRKLTGTPTYERAGITPDVSVRSMLNPSEKSVADFRKLGFTSAHTVPHNGMMAGTGAIILLNGSSNEDMLVKDNTALFSQWQGASGVYPNTVIGIMAKYRDLYRKAGQARVYSSKYASGSNGMERPNADKVIESLYPVVTRQLPVIFKTEELLDITRALTLKNDLGFNLMLGEVKQGWDVINQIKSSGVPVFLSFDLPEMKEEKEEKEEKEKEEKEEGDTEEKKAPTLEEEEKAALEKRKAEMVKNYYTQPSKFAAQDVKFGFSTMEGKSKDFKGNMMKIIENGLSEDKVLAALTTTPAELLGVSNLMGTVDNGKMANLIVTDKPYFEKESNVRYVFVDGVKYDFEVKEKKKKKNGSGEATVEPEGTWNYTVETPEGDGSGVIAIKGSNGDLSGTISVSYNGSTNDIRDVSVDGSTVTFSFTLNMGQDSTVDITMEIDGDSFEGTLSVAEFGSFPMEGSRDPK